MIVFEKIRYKNFKSVGNSFIEIDLNKHKTTLVYGNNGSGKSTIMSALCYCLFGKDYGDANVDLLINSINGKNMLTECEFRVGKKKYMVRRGMKPRIFEIYEGDGKLKNQDDAREYQKVLEQQILKMNYRAFTQVCVMGSGYYVPFMRLKTSARREFVEDLLDIRIFSVMNNLLKRQIQDTSSKISDIDKEIKTQRHAAKLQQEFIEKLQNEKKNNVDQLKADIDKYEADEVELFSKIDELLKVKSELLLKLEQYQNLRSKISTTKASVTILENKVEDLKLNVSQISKLDFCPTCKRDIDETHLDHLLDDFNNSISVQVDELNRVKDELALLMVDKKKVDELDTGVQELDTKILDLQHTVSVNQALINKAQIQIENLRDNTQALDEQKSKLKETAKFAISLDKRKKELLNVQEIQNISSALLQDNGIKSKIIKQYSPTINKLINKYLAALDFFVLFHLDENFSETVKSRHRDLFTYECFSEGQKLRIDLALTFAWREIAKMKNSVHTNLLFMDEILDSSLDFAGIDLFLDLISKSSIDNVFIISHRDVGEKFHDSIKFSIKNNFTVKE